MICYQRMSDLYSYFVYLDAWECINLPLAKRDCGWGSFRSPCSKAPLVGASVNHTEAHSSCMLLKAQPRFWNQKYWGYWHVGVDDSQMGWVEFRMWTRQLSLKKKKEDTHSSKNVFWSLGGTGFFSVPKIHCLAGWAYCFRESAVRVFQLREQMPSNCSDLGIWGQERRSHHLNRWLDAASHCNPLPLLPFSRVALEEGCQRGDYRVTQLIFTAGKGKYLPTSLSLALPESAQSIEAKC